MRMDPNLVKARSKVLRAMKKLEEDGFLVFREDLRCPSYAPDFHDFVNAMPGTKLAQAKGAVLWSEQEKERMKNHGLLVLGYSGGTHSDGTDVRLSTVDVGQAVVSALKLSGNIVEWDGNPTSTIIVTLIPKQEPV
jgi:hypothetical protein